MTRKELVAMLGYGDYSPAFLTQAIGRAKQQMPSIAQKITFDAYQEPSFTLEEIECICGNVEPPMNELKRQIIRENYIDHGVDFIQRRSLYIEGTEKYLERLKKDPKFRSCANCCYCVGKSNQGLCSKLRPFCKFYNRFISTIKVGIKHKNWSGEVKEGTRPASIFKDRCQSWQRGEIKYFYK